MMIRKSTVLICLILSLLGCTTDQESDLVEMGKDGEEAEPVTYQKDIRAIIGNNCLGCHSSPPINGAPFPLTTYLQVRDVAESGLLLTAIGRQTGEVRAMPPGGRLPQAVIDRVEEWIADGLLEE